jgi:iron complex transport system ATP-binding protein
MILETEAILLDEPTNHLDIRYQIMILDLLSKIEKLIVVVFHDLNLTAKYCERIILMGNGGIYQTGIQGKLSLKRTSEIFTARM